MIRFQIITNDSRVVGVVETDRPTPEAWLWHTAQIVTIAGVSWLRLVSADTNEQYGLVALDSIAALLLRDDAVHPPSSFGGQDPPTVRSGDDG